MPLLPGREKGTISRNVEELMHSYEEDGRIGNVRPRNGAHARRVAAAIAYDTAEESRSRRVESRSGHGRRGRG